MYVLMTNQIKNTKQLDNRAYLGQIDNFLEKI